MDVVAVVVGFVLLVVAEVRLRRWWAARRRPEELPPPLPVVNFRGRLSEEELDALGRRLRGEHQLDVAFHGGRPRDQARA